MSKLDRIEKLLEEIRDLMKEDAFVFPDPAPAPFVPAPFVPGQPTPYVPGQPSPWPEVTKKTQTTCSKCGMQFEGVTMYACSLVGCPMGLGGVY